MNSVEMAKNIRIKAVKMVNKARASHIGGALSMADIIAVLYNAVLKYDIKNPQLATRDRFVLSKGHNGVAVYAALSEVGFLSDEKLKTYYQDDSTLSGHVSHKGIDGIELSTGSLGHGISVACGFALAGKLDKMNYRTYVVVGDGECNEGSVWETALFANHNKLSNFTVIVDHNKMQSMDTCKNTMDLIDLAEKWRAFGWHVEEVDGHNHSELLKTFKSSSMGCPKCIIAHTIKGKGVSFMENNILWHYRDPQNELFEQAIMELEKDEK